MKTLAIPAIALLTACTPYYAERPGHVAEIVTAGALDPTAALTSAAVAPVAEALGQPKELTNAIGYGNTCVNGFALAVGTGMSAGAALALGSMCGMVAYSEAGE